MWLIEFAEGHLTGVAMPIESIAFFVGSEDVKETNEIPLPEYLPPKARWEIDVRGPKAKLTGVKRSGKPKILIPNKIYRIKGLSFFIYQDGLRNPIVWKFRFKQYTPLLIFTIFIHLGIAVSALLLATKAEESKIYKTMSMINDGYIKGGELYITDANKLKSIPVNLRKITKIYSKGIYQQVSQLNVEVISKYYRNPIKVDIIKKSDRDVLVVDTHEKELKIMFLFGKEGIGFIKEGKYWLVSKKDKAIELFDENGLDGEVDNLKSLTNEDLDVINPDDFPYSIFYSTNSGRYLYDQNNRYWVGSEVPEFGVIESITRDEVVFVDGVKVRVYLIKP